MLASLLTFFSLLGVAVASQDLPDGFEASLEKIAKGEHVVFSWPSSGVQAGGEPAPAPAPPASGKPAPDMKGGDNIPVPEWQKTVNDKAGDSQIMGDIASGAAIGEIFGPEGAAAGAVIGGIIGFIPQIAAIFHTSHSHSDTIVGELTGKGFSHISIDQDGPFFYHGLPYDAGGKKPVELVMNSIIKGHLSDFGDAATQSDLQTYAMVLANGWQDGSNTWVHQNIVYDAKNGGGTQAVHFMTNANLTAQKATIMFWKTKASIKLADDFIIHRVTDQSSNIFSSKSTCKDTLVRKPKDITYQDIAALTSFFDIMAGTALATTLNLCGATKLNCAYPDISPKASGSAHAEKNETLDVESFRPLYCSTYKCKSKCECAAKKCKTEMDSCYKDHTCNKVYHCAAKCPCGSLGCLMKCKSSSSKAKAMASCEQKHCNGEAEVVQV